MDGRWPRAHRRVLCPVRAGRGLGVAATQLCRLPDQGAGPGQASGWLRRLSRETPGVAGAVDQWRAGRSGGCVGSRRPDWPTGAAGFAGLRLCRNHRGLSRSPQPHRHSVLQPADRPAVSGRRKRANDPEPAVGHHPVVSRDDAVLPACLRCADPLPAAPETALGQAPDDTRHRSRMMDIDLLSNIFYAMVRCGTPLLLVALGELICEKSGAINLGQEGMMLFGAVIGFIVALSTGNLWLGVLLAMLAGMLLSALFALVALVFNANQVATGLALTIFGVGLSSFVGAAWVGKPLSGFEPVAIPFLSDIPLIGRMLFAQDLLVYLSFALFALVAWALLKSRVGLIIQAVGENPDAASAMGLPVLRVRTLAVLFGGAMAGLAGAYLSLAYTPMWAENMSAGRGWIALALVVFASWRVWRLLLGAYLFGLASILHLVAQGIGLAIPSNLLAMLPYVATIIVLVLLSRDALRTRLYAPVSLGQPWRAGH
ncbi:ABC transporter permease [Pseudomonas syringae pv. maculicola]|nr:ABC transporter permease [Pseudomonas syringae pv. maculicola]